MKLINKLVILGMICCMFNMQINFKKERDKFNEKLNLMNRSLAVARQDVEFITEFFQGEIDSLRDEIVLRAPYIEIGEELKELDDELRELYRNMDLVPIEGTNRC